jgi:DNA-binding MurR/RpiR family transcriptional regulator
MNRDFKNRLQSVLAKLTKNQKMLADHILNNPSSVPLSSASSLALKVGVSEATVIRFAQRLGYEGYLSMKSALQKEFVEVVLSSKRIEDGIECLGRKSPLVELLETHGEILDTFHVEETINCIRSAASILHDGKGAHIYGEGSSKVPAFELSFWLNRFGKKINVFGSTGRSFFENIVSISHGDVAVGFAFRKTNFELDILFRETHKRGGKNILITDEPLSTLFSLADESITISRGYVGNFRSMGIPVIIADALALEFAALSEKNLAQLKAMEALRIQYGFD